MADGVSGYVYAEFLRIVRAHQLHVRGRTEPTGCFVCDVLCPVGWMGGGRGWAREIRRCAEISGLVVDAHHLLPKRALREAALGTDRHTRVLVVGAQTTTRPLDDALMDPRNGILVRRYHHDALEGRRLAIPKMLWPSDALAFARELGLEWWIDNMEARRA